MNRQDFDSLVRQVEARYKGRPSALERSARRWITLGLAALVAWLSFIFLLGAAAFAAGAVLGGPGVILLGIGAAVVVYGMLQAALFLLVDAAPSGGFELKEPLPEGLASMLDALRAEFHCRPFDEVRVANEFNAGIREVPRLGLFGWPRTVLEIGLPLALSLNAEEMGGVLAHEFAHYSSRHARGGSRIYRLQRTWGNVFEQIQNPSPNSSTRAMQWAVSKFIDWYWPKLQARTLILSRAQEYEADRLASTITGESALVSSLWRIECVEPRLIEKFWPELYAQATRFPEPPDELFALLREALDSAPEQEDAARWAGHALARATSNDNTHPCFADRARALAAEPESFREVGYPQPPSPSAAEMLFGAKLDAIERELADGWKHNVAAGWRLRHRRAQADAMKTQAAATLADSESVSIQTLWTSARETFDRIGSQAAEPALRAVLARNSEHAGASVLLGHHLLVRGDAEGECLLLMVADLQDDEEWMPRAVAILHDHYRSLGRADQLREMRTRLDRHEVDLAAARLERSNVRASDRFLPHGLDNDRLAPLLAAIGSMTDCEAAWLARKDLKHFPSRPLFVLAIRARGPRWGFGQAERDESLIRRLVPRVELPGQSLVVSRHGGFGKVAAKIMTVAETMIHPHPSSANS